MDSHIEEHDLAKVLDSVAAELNEKLPVTGPSDDGAMVVTSATTVQSVDAPDETPTAPVAPDPAPLAAPSTLPTPSAAPASTGGLDDIKRDALLELRPLVDKLTVSPEEKFDTFLLLIRSTDDADLIGPAHEAAKAITDEARRAEALLDVIKEIDYLTQNKKA